MTAIKKYRFGGKDIILLLNPPETKNTPRLGGVCVYKSYSYCATTPTGCCFSSRIRMRRLLMMSVSRTNKLFIGY
jgi:hypothetical protein